MLPQETSFEEYPDLRPYQDLQFSTLVLNEADHADRKFSSTDWEFDEVKSIGDWQAWSRRLERHIVDACQVDVLKVASLVSTLASCLGQPH